MTTPQGNTTWKKTKVLPAIIFEIIKLAVKIPVSIAYNSVLVIFSNIFIDIYLILNIILQVEILSTIFTLKNNRNLWKLQTTNY